MLKLLKRRVCEANLKIAAEGLVIQTFGNASAVDRAAGMVVIKPSGISFDRMKPEQMVVVSLEDGRQLEGNLRPSSDTPTHLVLYRAFREIGGIVHTHSPHATAWAQARRDIPALGTTHADFFHGAVPCTRLLTDREIKESYEANTGHVIVERFARRDPLSCPAVVVASHGPFAWGPGIEDAVENAVALEYVARLAGETVRIRASPKAIQRGLLDKHFFRKHGVSAYYGQIIQPRNSRGPRKK